MYVTSMLGVEETPNMAQSLYLRAFQKIDVRYRPFFIVVLMAPSKAKNAKLFYNFVQHGDNSEKGGTFLGVYRQESRSLLPWKSEFP